MITAIGTVLVAASAVLAWTIVVLYHLSAHWWASEPGRHVMTFTASLAVVLTLWTVGLLIPTKGMWWEITRLVAFTGIPFGLGWRLRLLWKLQIKPGLREPARRVRHEAPPLFPEIPKE